MDQIKKFIDAGRKAQADIDQIVFDNLCPADFPNKKMLTGRRFAYLMPLTFGRCRINVTSFNDIWSVGDFY